jgi:formylglycine-generating enzyme required for sulfatase activity
MGTQNTDRSSRNYDAQSFGWESPVHEVCLDTYRISRHLVTVADYRQFVEGDGYTDSRWWPVGGFGEFAQPAGWQDQLLFPNRPVVGVSWFEASAFAAWRDCRLPTEAEWERAARGTDGRRFPWGNDYVNPSRLNFVESKIGEPTPVGLYPLGATPDGIHDMAGNVWEWCHDWFAEDYYQKSPVTNPTGPACGTERVLRGGGWRSIPSHVRSAVCYRGTPDVRSNDVGFRIVRVGVRTR